jgi:hypothetical protein
MPPHNETSPLTLVPRSKTIGGGSWSPDQYAVIHDGMTVGSIVKQSMAGTAERWWWEISTRGSPGVYKGASASRDGAMKAFRDAWDKLPK